MASTYILPRPQALLAKPAVPQEGPRLQRREVSEILPVSASQRQHGRHEARPHPVAASHIRRPESAAAIPGDPLVLQARRAERFAATAMAGRDASHDAAHAFRVRDLALSLAREEGLTDPSTLEVIELAALLHDIGDYKYTKNFVEDTKIVESFLKEEGLDGSKQQKIMDIIEGMGFKTELSRTKLNNCSVEFGIVQDADRLDAIGAIGIARCFTYGGSKNSILHDPDIPPRQDLTKEKYMAKDEKQTTINHFHEKLFKLKDLMKTKAGKRRAEKRHKFMEDFLAEFFEEWAGRA